MNGELPALLALIHDAHARGWVWATSGNFSSRVDDHTIAITRSGRDKGGLTLDDFGIVDLQGQPIDPSFAPSAETHLHCALYRRSPTTRAIGHTHSVAATAMSKRVGAGNAVRIVGYEMQKALAGVQTHEAVMVLPVFANSQDIAALSSTIDASIAIAPADPKGVHGYLVEGHGLTTWGRDIRELRRHLEAFEMLLACALHDTSASQAR